MVGGVRCCYVSTFRCPASNRLLDLLNNCSKSLSLVLKPKFATLCFQLRFLLGLLSYLMAHVFAPSRKLVLGEFWVVLHLSALHYQETWIYFRRNVALVLLSRASQPWSSRIRCNGESRRESSFRAWSDLKVCDTRFPTNPSDYLVIVWRHVKRCESTGFAVQDHKALYSSLCLCPGHHLLCHLDNLDMVLLFSGPWGVWQSGALEVSNLLDQVITIVDQLVLPDDKAMPTESYGYSHWRKMSSTASDRCCLVNLKVTQIEEVTLSISFPTDLLSKAVFGHVVATNLVVDVTVDGFRVRTTGRSS